MCGIAGELRFDGQPASRDAVAAMVDALAPRGPDGHGLVAAGRTALGHRRLAVIDPTPRSAQPMVDSELGLSIVYNGALYEYRRVRQRLVALGYRFTSDGDTEVVLKAFHAWGPECVLQLEGMFAFAITDAEGRCFIARDRMGIKPLYWSANGGRFRFASTLPALLAAGGVDTRLDPVALQQFCTLHGVVVAPHTVLQGVRKLPPATWMLIEADGARRERVYWTMERRPTPGVSPQAWTGRLREALITAVRRRCVADTPVGVLLSG
ncbi:MAG: N-acetylglutaminylglutamine amidotransferase, partial [Myxococcota bacterium]